MFIRTKKDPRRRRIQLQIVESKRTGPKVRQKLVAHVGAVPMGHEDRLAELRILAKETLQQLWNNPGRQMPLIPRASGARLPAC